jgi:hypothetical protein
MDGLTNILMRGLGIGATWLPVGILLGYTLALFRLVVWWFRAEI